MALVYSDPVVEHFDGLAKLRDTESLMEFAQLDARNLPSEDLSVGRLRQWGAVDGESRPINTGCFYPGSSSMRSYDS